MSKPTLGYWKIRGLAQPIRLLLEYSGQDYEDKQYEQGDDLSTGGATTGKSRSRGGVPSSSELKHIETNRKHQNDLEGCLKKSPEYSRDEWIKKKNDLGLDFPNLPYYIDGDIKITQSNSIIRYIAAKHGLLGSTDKEKVVCDMMLENAMDFRNGLVRLVYSKTYETMKGEYFKNVAEKLHSFNEFLGAKQWFAGDNITACDFPMYELLNQHELMKPGILDDYENLKKFTERFEDLPKIKAYMASNRFMARPVNNKVAAFK